jgi:hypothetical protein
MKPIFQMNFFSWVLIVLLAFAGCERSMDNFTDIQNPANPYVFLDGFSAGLNYAAFGGSVPTAFQVDREVTYNNTLMSMRVDVPNVNDPRGAYAGGTFFTSAPRDLSSFDALTFWAKATESVSIDVFGIGNDLGANRFLASINGVALSTAWQKIIIPLPDPSRLAAERGMFYFSTGPVDGKGYTFWMDEVKFEKLGTIAHPIHEIMGGQNQTISSFTTVTTPITGLRSTFSLPNGGDFSVGASAAYFSFTSSNPAVATVNEAGVITTGEAGSAVITASVGGVEARGSITIQSRGAYIPAPAPTHPAANVISIFSDAYTNVPVDYYNGYWAPYQTTLSADFRVGNDNVLHYTNFNFVGIQFTSPTIDARQMTHLRLSVFFPAGLAANSEFRVRLVDFGPNNAFQGGDDTGHTITFARSALNPTAWNTFDIPLANFTGLTRRGNLAQLIFEGTAVSAVYVDNIYLRRN